MTFLIKYYKQIILGLIVFGIIATLYSFKELLVYLHSPCNSTFQNYKVEFISGIIFSSVPIVIGIYFGQKIKEYQFYNNVEGVLKTVRRLRENKLINDLSSRHLVKSIARNFGNEALKDELAEKIIKEYESNKDKISDKCKICNLEAEIVGRKCKYCKLNCYAWDFSKETLEEKEISEIEKIVSEK